MNFYKAWDYARQGDKISRPGAVPILAHMEGPDIEGGQAIVYYGFSFKRWTPEPEDLTAEDWYLVEPEDLQDFG